MPTMTLEAHENMTNAAYGDKKERFHYSRFDGGDDLGALQMDEWKPNDRTGIAFFTGKHRRSGRDTIDKIELAISRYLDQDEVQQNLDRCARILVQRRRRQTRDQSRWDRFACASWYICPYDKCIERRHDTLESYRRHVLRFHDKEVNREQFDAEAPAARRCWLYRDKDSKVNRVKDDKVNRDGDDKVNRDEDNKITSQNITTNDNDNGPDRSEAIPASTIASSEL